MIAWLNVIVFSLWTLFVVNNNSKPRDEKSERNRTNDTIFEQRVEKTDIEISMLTRSIAYLLVDIAAAAAIEIYLFFVAIVVATPLLMPPLCGRSLLFVILRAHLSFNKTTSKTEEKNTCIQFRWQASSLLTCSSVLEMRASNARWPYSFSQSVSHSHTYSHAHFNQDKHSSRRLRGVFSVFCRHLYAVHIHKRSKTHRHRLTQTQLIQSRFQHIYL